ncbi:MAG TPA: hypothetical protein VNA28_05140 [Solirubrobacteraceae bacterium]|nr:hypothetical protein [Solirubrobacteraceae bacterium]
MATTTTLSLHKPIHYDSVRRRLWIFGQRCHHGATGALLTFAGAAGVAPFGQQTHDGAADTLLTFATALGVALMAHDWKDRSVWFSRGWQAD